MTQFRAQTQNTNNVWDSKKRYKVNSVVAIGGIEYQNTTGKNTDPILLTDWIITRQPIAPVYTQSQVDSLLLAKLAKNSVGWQAVADTVHTVGSPQSIAESATANFSNNMGTIFNSQLPTGHSTFWDSVNSKILPQNEDDYMLESFMFKAKNNNIEGSFRIFIDIPTLGERFAMNYRFTRGANIEQDFNIPINHFVSSQFKINGGIVKITSTTGISLFYDKQFRFAKVIAAH
jgi:hypothetical protein